MKELASIDGFDNNAVFVSAQHHVQSTYPDDLISTLVHASSNDQADCIVDLRWHYLTMCGCVAGVDPAVQCLLHQVCCGCGQCSSG